MEHYFVFNDLAEPQKEHFNVFNGLQNPKKRTSGTLHKINGLQEHVSLDDTS